MYCFSISQRERRVQELQARQGRSAQFKSTKERDNWLKKEIKETQKRLTEKRKQLSDAQKELERITREIDAEQAAKARKDETIEGHKTKQTKLSEEIKKIAEKRETAANRRKELWRLEADAIAEIQSLQEGPFIFIVDH